MMFGTTSNFYRSNWTVDFQGKMELNYLNFLHETWKVIFIMSII